MGRRAEGFLVANAGAALHPPAGTFSPDRDGEKGDGCSGGTHSAMLATGETAEESVFLP